ncbi:hypothetical protein [Delftia tsuruhatensis]|uniref:hypothetical protein n=1 Tax=Delftia tsuruhatensis TaxID=180282 RepID=UPI00289BB962|nr:hypothetical protein [Delftia tsuruhatensis]
MSNKIIKQPLAQGSRWLASALGGVCAALLAGCATTGDGGKTPEDIVNARSTAYLKARQGGNVDKAYTYLTPTYRALKNKERFRLENGAATVLKGGELLSTTCVPERCVVRRNFTTVVPSMPGVDVPISITEAWVVEDGQWWLFLE